MTPDTVLTIGIIALASAGAIALGFAFRPARRPTSGRPIGTRPKTLLERLEEANNAPLARHPRHADNYGEAVRLQRARRAAAEFISEIGATNEILPLDVTGVPRTGPRPLGPIDLDAMTRAIVDAWRGDQEPMVNVPIMKLSDVKIEHNEKAWDDAQKRLADDAQRRAFDRPTGGIVPKGKPYIVGEQANETVRPIRPKKGDTL